MPLSHPYPDPLCQKQLSSVSPSLPDQCSSAPWTEISLDNDPLSTLQDVPCHTLWTAGSSHRLASPWQPPGPLSSPCPHPETCRHISSSWVPHLELWSFSLGGVARGRRHVFHCALHFPALTPPNSAISHNLTDLLISVGIDWFCETPLIRCIDQIF